MAFRGMNCRISFLSFIHPAPGGKTIACPNKRHHAMKPKVSPNQITRKWASSSSPVALACRAGHQQPDHRHARGGTGNDGDETPTPWNLAPEADRFLNSRQVRRRYGDSSDMWLWRRLNDQSGFPLPINISGRRFWKLDDLVAWEHGHRAVAAQPADTSKPPEQSAIDSTFQRKAAADASISPSRRIPKSRQPQKDEGP
jgi:hypothetical protein